jgi:hypothetical protein
MYAMRDDKTEDKERFWRMIEDMRWAYPEDAKRWEDRFSASNT